MKFGIHLMRGVPMVAVQRKLPIKGTKLTAADIYSKEGQAAWLHDMYTGRNAHYRCQARPAARQHVAHRGQLLG